MYQGILKNGWSVCDKLQIDLCMNTQHFYNGVWGALDLWKSVRASYCAPMYLSHRSICLSYAIALANDDKNLMKFWKEEDLSRPEGLKDRTSGWCCKIGSQRNPATIQLIKVDDVQHVIGFKWSGSYAHIREWERYERYEYIALFEKKEREKIFQRLGDVSKLLRGKLCHLGCARRSSPVKVKRLRVLLLTSSVHLQPCHSTHRLTRIQRTG